MSHDIRRRLDRIERDIRKPLDIADRERQLSHALDTGEPPTDRTTRERYEAARRAFDKLGGTPTDLHFSQNDDGTIGQLFTVASDEEMEDARTRMGLAPRPKP